MIFKPSSLSKLFFTYICPRFYGGAPSAPASTTSTQTINQSPWQNPVYQALMLGTKDKPGPITSMLRSSAGQTAAWNDMLKGGYSPTPTQERYSGYSAPISVPAIAYAGAGAKEGSTYVPSIVQPLTASEKATQTVAGSARGGLMSLKGYASGGTAKTPLQKAQDKAANNKPLSATDIALLNANANNIALGGNGVITSKGVLQPPARVPGTSDAAYQQILQTWLDKGGTVPAKTLAAFPGLKPEGTTAANNLKNTIGTSITNVTADTVPTYDANGNITGYTSTNKDFLALQQAARDLKTPAEFAAASDMYSKSSAGLQAAAGYTPTDVKASMADVATMKGADKAAADQLKQYQMQGPGAISAPTAEASQMAGPKSWIDKGTSEAYMSPYMQNVVDIQKREANRDYQQQVNQLNAQSVAAGAFGGSRQAIQQAEAARNQAMRLGDIEAKGLQEAYTSGMGQFTNEQGQQLQAGQANLSAAQQTTLANQAAEIQAMMANQGMDYNTALQNLQAQMGIQGTQAGIDLQAALANQNIQQQTQGANQNAQNAANNAYAQAQLSAAMANQQAGLTANQQGISALQGVGQNASGLSNTGSAINQAGLANLGAQGQVVQAQQALSQQGVNNNQQTALNALGFTNSTNAGSVAAINAQPVNGGTTTGRVTNAPATSGFARGGLIRQGKVTKRGGK